MLSSNRTFLSSHQLKACGELKGWASSRRPCIHPLTLSNWNISDTSRSVKNKFRLKHYWGGGKASFGFMQDRIETLVSMATYNSFSVSVIENVL